MKRERNTILCGLAVIATAALIVGCAVPRPGPLGADVNPANAVVFQQVVARMALAESKITTLQGQTSTWAGAVANVSTLQGLTSGWETARANATDWTNAKAAGVSGTYTNGIGGASTTTVVYANGIATNVATTP